MKQRLSISVFVAWISHIFSKLFLLYKLAITMSFDAIPKDLRGLRACLVCSLVKSFDQFETDGCENCEEFLRMKNNKDNVYDHTSNNFDGIVALTTPTDSWVAKWQRLTRFHRGIYAISVSGTLPQSTMREMKNRGIVYKTRDRSQR